ncbi:hypothetical protein [Streptosporangium sp. OZ121]|uniref:hypothetical protein n=1 Tax=Streptosporangium sp. OZ121 TaxID=3444183 RepID=UPI003F79BB66
MLTRTIHAHPLTQLTSANARCWNPWRRALTNASIAQSLHVSQSAVEKHVNALFDKLALSHTTGYSCQVPAVLRYLGS